MPRLLDPRWLWGIAVLPFCVLWCLGYYQYTLIESLLPARELWLWQLQGWVLLAMIALSFCAAVSMDAAGKRIGIVHLTALFGATVSYGCWIVTQLGDLFPSNVSDWLINERIYLYVPTFLMPALVYTLFAAIHLSTREDQSYSAWPNFVGALLMPLTLYLFATLGVPATRPVYDVLPEYVLIMLGVVFCTLFLFLILRAVYLLGRNRRWWSVSGHIGFRFVLTVCCPILGLVVNNTVLFSTDLSSHKGMFGNFGHPLFYMLAVLNGLYCCLPRRDGLSYRVVLFAAGCSGLPFLLYFVVIFLPFLPLSVVAAIYWGAGLLMLVPLMMLPVQLRLLRDDYHYLTRHLRRWWLLSGAILLCCLLPAGITVAYRADRAVLNEALDYVYSPAEHQRDVPAESVARIIRNIQQHRKSSRGFYGNEKLPYLSQYYAWLVLDNLTLANDKLERLSRVYLGEQPAIRPRPTRRNSLTQTELTDLSAESDWDAETGSWTSWVHLAISADTLHGELGQYDVSFQLPPGAFIDDYYLYVGDHKKHGLLSERRAATWVYNQVVNTRRDPGLLRYEGADRLRLTVFPFRRGETRRTGFRIRHREPLHLQIDGKTAALGTAEVPAPTAPVTFAGGTYLPASFKASLPMVRLAPQVHFVLDASRRSPEGESALVRRIHEFARGLPGDLPVPTVSLCGTYVRQMSYEDDWEEQLAVTSAGGFFAQRAVEQIYGNRFTQSRTYPIIIVVGADPVLDQDFSAYTTGMPFDPAVYSLHPEGRLAMYSDGPVAGYENASNSMPLPGPINTYAYPNASAPKAWLRIDNKPAIVIDEGGVEEHTISESPWTGALEQYVRYLQNRREGRTTTSDWLTEVRGSFRTGVLMPTTAFLVLENAAQEEALRRKQAQIMSADSRLDLEEVTEMSEPGWWLLLLCLPLFWYFSPALRRKNL